MDSSTARLIRSMAVTTALWLALASPSAFIVQKYAGRGGVLVYAVIALAAAAQRRRIPVPGSRRGLASAAGATAVLVLGAFLAVYPRANVHTPGAGSDDDDALDLGVRSLAAGRSPYGERTYLGNALHQLPGAFVLAAPFTALGASALQNVFWLAAFFLAIAVETGDGRRALRLAWLVLAASPVVTYHVATGTGHLSNAIYVALGLLWLVKSTAGDAKPTGRRAGGSEAPRGASEAAVIAASSAAPHHPAVRWRWMPRGRRSDLAAAAWGVALASRPNFLFLLPLSWGWIARRQGRQAAARSAAATMAVVAALTLPFYVHDPGGFSPLEAANRLTQLDRLVPHAAAAIVLAMAACSVWAAIGPTDVSGLFWRAAAVQALPVAAGTLLGWRERGAPNLAYAAYGMFFTWFVLMAVALDPEDPLPACPAGSGVPIAGPSGQDGGRAMGNGTPDGAGRSPCRR